MTPAVSVVMAAYNGAALLPETLRSLERQSFRDWELVVVDDRSTDETAALLRDWPDPRVRLIEAAANGGPVRARNLALSHARGRYIAALDQDDLCLPERLERQVRHLERNADMVAVGAAAAHLTDGRVGRGGLSPATTPALVRWLLRIENPLVWSSMMIRGTAARALEPFTRPELLYAEDFDLYHRLAELGEVARLDQVLLHYRVHRGGASQRFADTMGASARAVFTRAHRPLFGAAAPRTAELFERHLMRRVPVPDRATLAELGNALSLAQAHHLLTHELSDDDRRLIRWETAARWGRVGRAALRAGALGLAEVASVRPAHLGLGYAGLETLVASRAVGATRTLVRS